MEKEAVLSRIVKVLRDEPKDEIPSMRFEIAYKHLNERDLYTDLDKIGETVDSIFEWGVKRGTRQLNSNGIIYKLVRNRGENVYKIYRQREGLHISPNGYIKGVTVQYEHYQHQYPSVEKDYERAKVSSIYEICNEILAEQSLEYIPIDLLEEKALEKFMLIRKVLSDDHRGENFRNLITRAGVYIDGFVKNGKLYKNKTTTTSANLSSEEESNAFPNEPLPPYRPSSSFGTSESRSTAFRSRNLMQAPAYFDQKNRFSRISPEIRDVLSSTLSNLTRGTNYDEYSFKNFCYENRSIVKSLLQRYRENRAMFLSGTIEVEEVQRAAMLECEYLWSGRIKELGNFLYFLKAFWIDHEDINCIHINGTFLDRTLNASGNLTLDWSRFGNVTEDDFILWKLFVPIKNPPPDKFNHVEVHPCIQLLSFYRFSPDESFCFKMYDFLEYDKSGIYEASFDEISNALSVDKRQIMLMANKHPKVFHASASTEMIKLKRPLPFFVLKTHG